MPMTSDEVNVFGAFMREIDDKTTATSDAALQTVFNGALTSPLDLFNFITGVQLLLRHPSLSAAQQQIFAEFLDKTRAYFADCPTVLDAIRLVGTEGVFPWWT
jgi:hypothetical protein